MCTLVYSNGDQFNAIWLEMQRRDFEIESINVLLNIWNKGGTARILLRLEPQITSIINQCSVELFEGNKTNKSSNGVQ